jgi:serine/threonine-protein kinase
MPPRSYGNFSLSPDGRRLAIVIADPNRDLWVQDLERGALTRLTSGAEIGTSRWWDDTRVVFGWRTNPAAQIFWVPSDGSGEPEPLTSERFVATSLSPDRQLLAGFRQDPVTGQDLYVLRLKGNEAPQLFLRTRFREVGPMFSPDGRWIAYVSDESGQYEIYVRPYPGPGGKWQVSTEGGEHMVWSRDGEELFYRNGQKWVSVAVNLKAEFTAETPRLLFEGPHVMIGSQSYDVTPDGQQFLLLEPVEQEAVTHLNVVLNWFEEVKQKASLASVDRAR